MDLKSEGRFERTGEKITHLLLILSFLSSGFLVVDVVVVDDDDDISLRLSVLCCLFDGNQDWLLRLVAKNSKF